MKLYKTMTFSDLYETAEWLNNHNVRVEGILQATVIEYEYGKPCGESSTVELLYSTDDINE